MGTQVLWVLVALAAALLLWWVSQVDWTAVQNWYCVLPDQIRCILVLLLTGTVLLALQGVVLLTVGSDATTAVPVALGGLLVLILWLVTQSKGG